MPFHDRFMRLPRVLRQLLGDGVRSFLSTFLRVEEKATTGRKVLRKDLTPSSNVVTLSSAATPARCSRSSSACIDRDHTDQSIAQIDNGHGQQVVFRDDARD